MGRQLGFEHPVDQALFELGEQAVGSNEVLRLTVIGK